MIFDLPMSPAGFVITLAVVGWLTWTIYRDYRAALERERAEQRRSRAGRPPSPGASPPPRPQTPPAGPLPADPHAPRPNPSGRPGRRALITPVRKEGDLE